MEKIGQAAYFTKFRKQQLWTQKECANSLGVSVSTVRAIEQGRQLMSGPISLLVELYAANIIPRSYML
jgi:transcriptional regulator with XRE-family HTH domain